jgi:hypothetical protein
MAVQPAELLAEIGDPPMLPRICRLTAKYAAIAAGIYPRGIAAVPGFESQVNER